MTPNTRPFALIAALAIVAAITAASCTITYRFNGASIDYSKIKSISIKEFTNNASLVYTPLTVKLNEKVNDIYARQTRLQIIKTGGDLELEGAITNYSLVPVAIGKDALASENKLSMTVKISFVNNVTGEETNSTFSASRNFSSSNTLEDVQDSLIEEMTDEIVDQIFNATVANW